MEVLISQNPPFVEGDTRFVSLERLHVSRVISSKRSSRSGAVWLLQNMLSPVWSTTTHRLLLLLPDHMLECQILAPWYQSLTFEFACPFSRKYLLHSSSSWAKKAGPKTFLTLNNALFKLSLECGIPFRYLREIATSSIVP